MAILNCGRCPLCGESATLLLPEETALQVAVWNSNGRPSLIQHAFPSLTAGQRETILTGAHEVCFDRTFADDEGR